MAGRFRALQSALVGHVTFRPIEIDCSEPIRLVLSKCRAWRCCHFQPGSVTEIWWSAGHVAPATSVIGMTSAMAACLGACAPCLFATEDVLMFPLPASNCSGEQLHVRLVWPWWRMRSTSLQSECSRDQHNLLERSECGDKPSCRNACPSCSPTLFGAQMQWCQCSRWLITKFLQSCHKYVRCLASST